MHNLLKNLFQCHCFKFSTDIQCFLCYSRYILVTHVTLLLTLQFLNLCLFTLTTWTQFFSLFLLSVHAVERKFQLAYFKCIRILSSVTNRCFSLLTLHQMRQSDTLVCSCTCELRYSFSYWQLKTNVQYMLYFNKSINYHSDLV